MTSPGCCGEDGACVLRISADSMTALVAKRTSRGAGDLTCAAERGHPSGSQPHAGRAHDEGGGPRPPSQRTSGPGYVEVDGVGSDVAAPHRCGASTAAAFLTGRSPGASGPAPRARQSQGCQDRDPRGRRPPPDPVVHHAGSLNLRSDVSKIRGLRRWPRSGDKSPPSACLPKSWALARGGRLLARAGPHSLPCCGRLRRGTAVRNDQGLRAQAQPRAALGGRDRAHRRRPGGDARGIA